MRRVGAEGGREGKILHAALLQLKELYIQSVQRMAFSVKADGACYIYISISRSGYI